MYLAYEYHCNTIDSRVEGKGLETTRSHLMNTTCHVFCCNNILRVFCFLEHTAARRFPADSEDTYMHFISPLNFDAINGHIVVGVA